MRSLSFLLAFLMLALLVFPTAAGAAAAPTAAAPAIQLYLNGKQLVSEVAPRIVKDSTVVPIRVIAEELGAKVQWDGAARKVKVDKEKTSIELKIDQSDALVNNKKVALDLAPLIVEGNTMLPLRFVGEQLGVKVTWDDLTRSVFLFQKNDLANVSDPAVTPADSGKPNAGTSTAGTAAGSTSTDKQPATGGSQQTDKSASAGGGQQTDKPSAAGSGQQTDKPSTGTAPDKVSGLPLPQPGSSQQGNGSAGTAPTTPSADGKTPAQPDKPAAGQPGSTASTADPKSPFPLVTGFAWKDGQVQISYSGKEPKANVIKLSDPNRIVIDYPYSVLDPALKLNAQGQGEVTVPAADPTVQKIRYLLFSTDPSVVRIIIDLKKKADAKPVASKQAGTAAFELKPAANGKYTVVIDAGHGDKDTGAISVTGKAEKDFNLAMTTKVTQLLSQDKDIEVITTRDDDTFLELAERVEVANQAKADLFLSIHGNKFTNPAINGVETYYSRKESLFFANIIHKYALAGTGSKDRNVRQNDFYVIKHTTMPAVLLEVGYLSNKEEEALMYQEAFQAKLAASIVEAIKEALASIKD